MITIGRPAAALLAFVLGTVAACGGAGATSGPTTAPSPTGLPTAWPTPTPVGGPVVTPADAARLVIGSDPRFEGAIPLTPDVIGASKWWTATANAGGGFRVELTIGWGDCPSGCIDRHTWTFDVDPDGTLTLVGETGSPLPSQLPAP